MLILPTKGSGKTLSRFGNFSSQHLLARGRGRWRLLAAAIGVASLATPATADVIELSPEGMVSVRNGAGAAVFDLLEAQAASPGEPTTSVSRPPVENVGPSVAYSRGRANRVPAQFAGMVETAAASANISPTLLAALVWQESRWNANALSPKGAMGLAQLMPGTARDLGVDPRNTFANLMGGARYLRQMLNRFDGNLEHALAAYNAGPKRVQDARGIPAIRETQAYVKSIVQRASLMEAGGN